MYTTFFNFIVRRTYVIALLCWVAVVMHLVFWPSHSKVENWLETGSLFALAFIATTSQAESLHERYTLHLAIILMAGTVLVSVAAATIWAFTKMHGGTWRKRFSSLAVLATTNLNGEH